MAERYKTTYANDTVYGNVVELVKELKIPDDGVHLDIACGYSAINHGLVLNNLNFDYVGIDANREKIEFLNAQGIEAHCNVFGSDEEENVKIIESVLNGRNPALITALDIIEHLAEPEILLKSLQIVATKYNVPLIISVPNVCHKDIAFKMLEGEFDYTETGLLDKTHLTLFSAKRLQKSMENAGFHEVGNNDFIMENSDQYFPWESTFLAKGTAVYEYLEWLKKLVDPYYIVNQFVRAYVPMKKTNDCTNTLAKPFLSVITRTQGKRTEALAETLLCLTAQTNTDFEVLIMGHKLKPEGQKNVEKAIEYLPDWIRQKVRLIKVEHGNRTAPLNVGFENARGEYISILDDDDIVFDNWVEEFYKLSKSAPGSILHAYSVKQDWKVKGEALRAVASPEDAYCVKFNLLDQLTINRCPTMSYACPSYSFQKLGIKFNEQLTTTEDWDFLMRTAFVASVSDATVVTSIYRLWMNSDNSLTIHSNSEWSSNEKAIRLQFDKTPIVVPKGYIAKTSFCKVEEVVVENPNLDAFTKAVAYVDYGSGYSEQFKIFAYYGKSTESWKFTGFLHTKVSHLRIDPTEDSLVWLTNVSIEVVTQDDEKLRFDLNNTSNNGMEFDDGLLFVLPDPQINIVLEQAVCIKEVNVVYGITKKIPEHIVQQDCRTHFTKHGGNKSLLYRGMRKIYRIAKRIAGKE